ncbi:MAG: grasp-with-spasm system ATP-grasp peptide maturase [Paludibacter sp.]|nr:grasp-with-spasm system ATP-grasp peptide maturase [Paludibacter sp.]
MILILSNQGDLSTDYVTDWLYYYKANFLRINSFDLLNDNLFFDITTESIAIGSNKLEVQDIKSVWFRKFGFFKKSYQADVIKKHLKTNEYQGLSAEFSKALEIFENLFTTAFWLTNPKILPLNKILILQTAQKFGFKIPHTYLVNNKKHLLEIAKKEKSIISKSINDPTTIVLENVKYSMYTTVLNDSDIEYLPEHFMPSMIQECIEKQYEVRTFYICGQCFSMAIMSQSNIQTDIDFRKYNLDMPNRFVPYKLPNEMENKISNLMNEIGLNTGSLDFIVDKNGDYVFLEINPTGQFGMVDFSCNYGLHRKVAEILIENDK